MYVLDICCQHLGNKCQLILYIAPGPKCPIAPLSGQLGPGAQLSGAQLSRGPTVRGPTVRGPNCPGPNCPGAQLSGGPTVRGPTVRGPNCPGAQLSGAQLSEAQLSGGPTVRKPNCPGPNCPPQKNRQLGPGQMGSGPNYIIFLSVCHLYGCICIKTTFLS